MTVLSGGTGITKPNLAKRVVRRVNDRAYEFVHTNAPTGSGTSLTGVPSDATKIFTVGGWIQWLYDDTLDEAVITDIPTTTSLTIRRDYFGTTGQAHAANAVVRYLARAPAQTLSEIVDDTIEGMWPDLYTINETNFSVPATNPENWYALPADCEEVMHVYQQAEFTAPAVKQIKDIYWNDSLRWLDSTFVSTKKGLYVRGVDTVTEDSKLHVIYAGRSALTDLNAAQIKVATYEACAELMASQFAGESKPERRSGLEGAPDSDKAFQYFKGLAALARDQEAKRLREYLPRRYQVQYRQGFHHRSDF